MTHVTQVTETKCYHRVSQTTTATLPVLVPTTVKPVSSSTTSVIGCSLNALKFKLYLQTGSTVPTSIQFIGWNYCPDLGAWIPQALLSVSSLTFTAQTTVTSLGTLGALTALTMNPLAAATSGNPSSAVHFVNSGSLDNNTILLNTRGCEFVQVITEFTPGTAGLLTILHAGL